MLNNVTVIASRTTEPIQPSPLSEELSHTIWQVFRYVILPCISVLGIVGNVTNIVILAPRGFKKCSNVLLMALSVSDVLLLTGINNIPRHIYVESIPPAFRFSETINFMLYILCMMFSCAYTVGIQSAMVIPALITGERLLVILSPLRVYFILTPRRILVAVSSLYIFSAAYFLYHYIICIQFKQFVVNGFTIGVMLYSDVYVSDARSRLNELIDNIANYTTGVIPICSVTLGCAVIGIELAFIARRRKRMISRQVKPGTNTTPSRTTKMLLSICVLYIVCSGFGFLRSYVAQVKLMDQGISVQNVLDCIQDLLLCINCVGDFVIYASANSRFRRPSHMNR